MTFQQFNALAKFLTFHLVLSVFTFIGVAALAFVMASKCYADNPNKAEYIASAKAMEWKYGVKRGLVVSTCEQESQWNPFAESEKGAQGLCQIMPDTFIAIIKQYQRDNGLEPDGVIGPKTWAVLRPGVPYRWMSNRDRLRDPFQATEFAALYLSQIERFVSSDPVIMMGVYYGGQRHHMVRYQLEVTKRLEVYSDL